MNLFIIEEKFSLFSLITVSVFLEALPFLLLGSLLAALFEEYLSDEWLRRISPKRRLTGILAGLGLGLLLPTCECGVVPVVRKLLQKKLPPALVVTYLFSAPVLNPIVMISTLVAFRYSIFMLIGRVALVMLTAGIMGYVFSRYSGGLVKQQEHHETCACCHPQEKGALRNIVRHTVFDLFNMSGYFILGAFAAAAFQVFMPQNIVGYFSGSQLASIAAMMLLAVLLSVCSHADAFIAATFTRLPLVSQLAFVVIGPMVDVKLAFMFYGTFKRKVSFAFIAAPLIIVFLLTAILWAVLK